MNRAKLYRVAGLVWVLSSACSSRGAPTSSGAGAGMSGTATSEAGRSNSGSAGTVGLPSGGSDVVPASGSAGLGGGDDATDDGAAGAARTLPTLVTSAQHAYWKTDGALLEVSGGAAADVTVDEDAVGQLWQGFGGTFSERSADALSQLSVKDRDRAMNLLFGRDGLRLRYGRIPIGASDYAIDRYSLDETPNDTAMAAFSVERDEQRLIPYIRAALAVAPELHLWASPWSPPTWMKTNAAFDSGEMKEDDATLRAFALYLSKFVQEYRAHGIPIEVVHPQKEPNLGLDFPSCVWSAAAMTKFIASYLGPMFAEQKVGAEIFLGSLSMDDHSGKSLDIINAVTADPAGMSYVKGFGFEWDGVDLVAAVRARDLPIWQDNHNVGNLPWLTPFSPTRAPNDHAYAVSSWAFVRDWIKAGVDAYFTSNMVLDSDGLGIGERAWPQNALLVVDRATKTLIVTPAFYLFQQLSPFVDPCAHLLGTSGGDALAFGNPDGTQVVVLYNSGAAARPIVAIRGKKLQFDLPENGWATLAVR